MDDYRKLVEEYEKKLAAQKQHCAVTKVNPLKFGSHYHLPKGTLNANILYLGYGRNAWQSTWINRYYPGSVSFFEKDLMEMAEELRVQGSQFKISSRPALVLQFETAPIAIMSVNGRPFGSYEHLLGEVEPWNLSAFWASPAFQQADWLLVFRLSGWRPDLFPKNRVGLRAEPQGTGRGLKWNRVEEARSFDGFGKFRDDFNDRFLNLKKPCVCSCS